MKWRNLSESQKRPHSHSSIVCFFTPPHPSVLIENPTRDKDNVWSICWLIEELKCGTNFKIMKQILGLILLFQRTSAEFWFWCFLGLSCQISCGVKFVGSSFSNYVFFRKSLWLLRFRKLFGNFFKNGKQEICHGDSRTDVTQSEMTMRDLVMSLSVFLYILNISLLLIRKGTKTSNIVRWQVEWKKIPVRMLIMN